MVIMLVPAGFCIRELRDVKKFLYEILMKDASITIITDEKIAYEISREKDGIKVYEKKGNLYDVFNPQIQLSFQDDAEMERLIYKLRKYINKKMNSG